MFSAQNAEPDQSQVIRRHAHEPRGWRPTVLAVTIRRHRFTRADLGYFGGDTTGTQADAAKKIRIAGTRARREVAEQRMINRMVRQGRTLENKVNPIGKARRGLLHSYPRNMIGL
jgi:hypothetical protein